MYPPGWRKGAVDEECTNNDDGPDDEDQEGRGAIADVEAGKIEAARAAARREAEPAGKQRSCGAAGTAPSDRRRERRGPFSLPAPGHPACGAPQPPQT